MDGTLPLDIPAQTSASPDLPPLIADNFAGGGGASTAIELALGRSPDVAINHSETALALHEANHPETLHLQTSVYTVDPRDMVQPGQRVGLAWFSPDCKHFSKAKGGQPLNKNIRDLAWVVVHWAERVRPEVILLENVEEFQTWGPLRHRHTGGRPTTAGNLSPEQWDAAPPEVKGEPVFNKDGTPYMEADPLRRGQTFQTWVSRLRKLGYKVEWKELRACDFGAPTIRKRLFVVARCDGRLIRWPAPSHGAPDSEAVQAGQLKPWRTAAECIDWSLPCPSIFDTKEEIKARLGITAVRPLAKATLARIARGMKRYVLEAERPFIVNLTHGGRVEDAGDPLRTVTGANRGEKAAVVPHVMTMRNAAKPFNGADAPTHTITAGGAGLTLVAPSITRFNSGATGQEMSDPLATITANSFKKRPGGCAPLGLLAPTLVSVAHGDSGGRREYPMQEVFGTVTAGGISHAISVPHLLSLKGTARRDSGADAPHLTVLAGGNHSALVAPVLTYAQHGGAVRSVEDPHHTICANSKDINGVIIPTLVQTGYGERQGQAPRALDPNTPLGTVVAGGVKHAAIAAALMGCGGRAAQSRPRGTDEPAATITAKADTCIASAFLAQQNGGPRMEGHAGHDPRSPISTIAATGSHQMPVAAWFAKYYGTGDGAPMDDPCHTITVKDRMSHCEAACAAPPFTESHMNRAREVADFLREHGAWNGDEFVTLTIEGEAFVVVDIGMRMLTPRELFRAQGFPEDYVIEGRWTCDDAGEWHWHPFTKNTQVSCCGNSVSPPPAEALIRANCGHLAAADERTSA
jgi:DNA (cytosine-5)-methyltransferase 1